MLLIAGVLNSAFAAGDQCAPLFKSKRLRKSDVSALKLTLGKRIVVQLAPGERDPQQTELMVIGRYNDQVALVNPNNLLDVHFLTTAYMERLGYTSDLRNFPLMTAQTGPTCLPFAIAYLQNVIDSSKHLSAVPDFFRAGFMSLSMTFNPFMQFGREVQIQNAEFAMRASGIAYERTKELRELTAHLSRGGIALVGLGVGFREGTYSEVPLQAIRRPKVATPQARIQGAHAMVAIGVVDPGEYRQKLYILLDPASGEITVTREIDLSIGYIESFLIRESSSAL
jgi:hypothetical protein